MAIKRDQGGKFKGGNGGLKNRVSALEKHLMKSQFGREVVILVVKEGDGAPLASYQYNGPGQGMTIIIPDNNRGDRTPDVIL